jgi:hypothetical protein
MRLLKGDKNQCTACNELFNSNKPFEMHRIGKHGVNRRCMNKDEMLAAGMSVNDRGFWIGSKMPDNLRRHYERENAQEGTGTV